MYKARWNMKCSDENSTRLCECFPLHFTSHKLSITRCIGISSFSSDRHPPVRDVSQRSNAEAEAPEHRHRTRAAASTRRHDLGMSICHPRSQTQTQRLRVPARRHSHLQGLPIRSILVQRRARRWRHTVSLRGQKAFATPFGHACPEQRRPSQQENSLRMGSPRAA